eukprot:EG_transcript_53223
MDCGEEGPAPPYPFWEEENERWELWAQGLSTQLNQMNCRVSSMEEQVVLRDAQPLAAHIEKSLDETRAQVVEHLVSEGIKLSNALDQKAEQILLQCKSKVDQHMLEF